MKATTQLEQLVAVFASWLATLGDTTSHPVARAEASKRLAAMFKASQDNLGLAIDNKELLATANVELLEQLQVARKDNGELREFRRKVAALTLESTAVVLVRTPGQQTVPVPPTPPSKREPLRVVQPLEGA